MSNTTPIHTAQEQVNAWQVSDAVKYFRILLFIFMFFVAAVFGFYAAKPNYFTSTLLAWGITSSILIFLGLAISRIITLESGLSLQTRNLFMYSASFLAGAFIGLGIQNVQLDVLIANPSEHLLAIACILLAYIATQIAATYFLTQRFTFFLLFIVPTFLPALQLYLLDVSNIEKAFYFLFLTSYYTTILYVGYRMSRERLTGLNKEIATKKLFDAKMESEQTAKQLSEEIKKLRKYSHVATQELEQQQQLLQTNQSKFNDTVATLQNEIRIQRDSLTIIQESNRMLSWHWDLEKRHVQTSSLHLLFGERFAQLNNMDELFMRVHPEDKVLIRNSLVEHMRGNTEQYEVVYRFKRDDQNYMWIRDIGRATQRDPNSKRVTEMVGVSCDITREHNRNEWFKMARKLFDHAAQGFFALNKEFNYQIVNPYFLNLLQVRDEQVIGQHLFKVFKNKNNDSLAFSSEVMKQLSTEGFYEGEVAYHLHEGNDLILWVHISSIFDERGEISQYVGIINDLTNYKSSEQQLSYLQSYDTITDLPNRSYFNEQIQVEIENHYKQNKQFALVRINLDRFRHYNELLSQQGADELLHQVASRLRQLNEEETLIARLSADDFVMLMDFQGDKAQLIENCKGIMKVVKKPFKINGHEFSLTLSIGISIFPDHGRHSDLLNYHAELALMEAKRIGGNSIRIYQDEKSLSSVDRTILENDLRRAVENRELSVFFQPKLNLKTYDINSFEALIRWKHPKLGLIPPSQFIPIAEESSLISDIGTLVLEMTCGQIKRWAADGYDNVSVSVNIVAQQIQRGDLLDEIDFLLNKYDIEPKQLELEITETSIMDNTKDVKSIMLELQQRGLSISVDDFGTGYSSLSYLAQYPFDLIKIDRSFISKIGTHQQDAIIKAIIAMAKAMKKKVVAEGVESKEQFIFLEQEGCDYLQGYFIGKAVEVDEATALLDNSEILIKKYSNISE